MPISLYTKIKTEHDTNVEINLHTNNLIYSFPDYNKFHYISHYIMCVCMYV